MQVCRKKPINSADSMSPKIPARWSWNVWKWNVIDCSEVLQTFKDIHQLAVLFYHGASVPVGQGLLNVEDSWSHSDTLHSVGLLWTSDQPDAETST